MGRKERQWDESKEEQLTQRNRHFVGHVLYSKEGLEEDIGASDDLLFWEFMGLEVP